MSKILDIAAMALLGLVSIVLVPLGYNTSTLKEGTPKEQPSIAQLVSIPQEIPTVVWPEGEGLPVPKHKVPTSFPDEYCTRIKNGRDGLIMDNRWSLAQANALVKYCKGK